MLRGIVRLAAYAAATAVLVGCSASAGGPAANPAPVASAGAPTTAGAPGAGASPSTGAASASPTPPVSPAVLLAQVRAAAQKWAAYRIKGTTTYAGAPLAVDLTVTAAAARGSVTRGNNEVKVVRVGGTAYLKGPAKDVAALTGVSSPVAGRDQWLAVSVGATSSPVVALTGPGRTLSGSAPSLVGNGFFLGQSARLLRTGAFGGLTLLVPQDGPTLIGVLLDPHATAPLAVASWPSAGFAVKPPARSRVVGP